jgi:hypothetical protein
VVSARHVRVVRHDRHDGRSPQQRKVSQTNRLVKVDPIDVPPFQYKQTLGGPRSDIALQRFGAVEKIASQDHKRRAVGHLRHGARDIQPLESVAFAQVYRIDDQGRHGGHQKGRADQPFDQPARPQLHQQEYDQGQTGQRCHDDDRDQCSIAAIAQALGPGRGCEHGQKPKPDHDVPFHQHSQPRQDLPLMALAGPYSKSGRPVQQLAGFSGLRNPEQKNLSY